MATQIDQLMARLRDANFRKELLETCERVWNGAQYFYNDAPEEDKHLKGDWPGSLEAAMNLEGWPSDLLGGPAESLPNPRIILPGELWDEFEVYLGGECGSLYNETYDAYLDHIEHRLLKPRKSEPFSLCTLSFPEGSQKLAYMIYGTLLTLDKFVGNVNPEEIKKTEALIKGEEEPVQQVIGRIAEFDVLFEGVRFSTTERTLRKPDLDDSTSGTLYVEISARASAKAMDAFVSELAPLAQSHFGTVARLDSGLTVEVFQKYLPFAMSCLQMAILNASNKDTFQRRIANAVRLLAAADDQRSDPIGLSLCVTAIDALLGQKGQEVSNHAHRAWL